MQYKNNWDESNARWEAWWNGETLDRPILRMLAKREKPLHPYEEPVPYACVEDKFLDVKRMHKEAVKLFAEYDPIAETVPSLDIHLGAGSLALYTGAKPHFRDETLWYEPCIKDYEKDTPLTFGPDSEWLVRHLDMTREGIELCKGTDMKPGFPDICESIDILAALRDPQTLCYDLYDYPEEVHACLNQLDDAYKLAYECFEKLIRQPDGFILNSAFYLWGKGRVGKVQCDHNAVMSPKGYKEFQLPHHQSQCQWLDRTAYHLDGPDCARHIDDVLGVKELTCLQYTPAHCEPEMEMYDHIYKKAVDAGKRVWVHLGDKPQEGKIYHMKRYMKMLGKSNPYFILENVSRKEADELLLVAEKG